MVAQRSSRRSAGAHDGQRDRVDVLAALAAAVAGVGGAERDGQRQMAVAVQDGDATRRAPARAGGHRHGQVAGVPRPRGAARVRAPADPSSWRRRPSPCSASWSSATSRCSPTASSRCSAAGPTSRSSRAGTTTCAGTACSPGAPDESPGADERGAVRAGTDHRAGQGRRADPRSGPTRRDDRRPGRARARSGRPCLAGDVGDLARVPRRPALPGGGRAASPSWPGSRPAAPTSWSPTTRCSRSTRSPASRCCPSTTSSSSTRRTSWSTGRPGPSPTS